MNSNKIINKYYDYSNPGSFSGETSFKKNNPEFKIDDIKETLSSTKAYTNHKKYIKRKKFYTHNIDYICLIDLIDVARIRNNFLSQGYSFI